MLAGPGRRIVLSVKKVLAGRGAVDYYLAQTRHGLADYYLPEPEELAGDGAGRALSAPGSSWWGGGAAALGLDGEVDRERFVAMYATGHRPDGEGFLGSRFRLPEDAAAAKREALHQAGLIEDPYERWMATHKVRRSGKGASVAAWDCTFSPVKSISLLWASGDADVQREVWAAHTAAVDAALAYLQEHAAYVRAGRNGVRVLDTSGLVVARMNEWTSRSGDMQLHTHCLVLNRAQTLQDGRWRALDGRALLTARQGAGAIYNRTVEAELTRRLGVAWRDRPDGLRELEGVDDELIEMFSTRRRAITGRLAEMAEAYRDRYGVEPPPAVVSSMAQHATLTTRPSKRTVSGSDALEAWEATARAHGRRLAELRQRVVARGMQRDRTDVGGRPHDDVTAALRHLAASGRTTFTRHDLLRAALDAIPPASRSPDELRTEAEALVDLVVASPDLLAVTVPDPLASPEALRRRDGTGVYTRPDRERWALRATLDQERWLLDVAPEPTGRLVDAGTLEPAIVRHGLGDDQATAVHDLLAADRRIGLLVGPAGAGKTRALRAVVGAWHATGRGVLGLTVSQAAAQVLSTEAGVRAENTTKWLHETRNGSWQLPSGALVLIDEATMVPTADLVDLVDQARAVGGRVVLVGDPAQLGAIGTGGAFELLADRHGAAQLHDIRRFTELWERDASHRLRARDPAALAEYAMRGRIHTGTRAAVEAELFEAWRADALAPSTGGRRRSVAVIVATNEQAAVVAERARHELLAAGIVSGGLTARLRDNVASVGDHIVTRRNDRRLRTSATGWVVNGDVWTVIEVHHDGAVEARRHRDGATITLPADYLAAHCHLAYATTVHRAQGITVDVCHAAISPDTTHAELYVAATRGRDANHLWVAPDHDTTRDPDDLPEPEHILTRILSRRDPDRASVHQAIEDALHDVGSLARLGAIHDDATRTATSDWLGDVLRARGLGTALHDPQWPTLVARLRDVGQSGGDVAALLDDAIRARNLDDARSEAAVLHWRLGALTSPTLHMGGSGPRVWSAPGDSPAAEVARQAAELIRVRWDELRAALAGISDPLPWAPALGARPPEPEIAAAWLDAATAITAYRERYELAEHTAMLGPRPAASRPEARAAFDHARALADHYLARRLDQLDAAQLERLDADQRSILDNPPNFNPFTLEHARRSLDAATRAWSVTSGDERQEIADGIHQWRLRLAELERAADRHGRWRIAAEAAIETLRHTEIARQQQRLRLIRR